jgi:hypothetical protein
LLKNCDIAQRRDADRQKHYSYALPQTQPDLEASGGALLFWQLASVT